jgi:acetate kinase
MSAQPSGNILALNSGSSSLKIALFTQGNGDEDLLAQGGATGIGRATGKIEIRSATGARLFVQDHVLESQSHALAKLVPVLRQLIGTAPIAVGHRIVHGGPKLREHQPLTASVMQELESATHFAPLHIPAALQLVRQAERLFPDALQMACFDTAFHRTMPEVATRMPLPKQYFDQGVMRYGFHGLSYESIVHRLGPQLPRRAIFAHLGNGCSVTAVLDGKSIDTSMGLTPTGGVPMSTRTGDLDPGVLLYLMRTEDLSSDELEDLVNRHSGLAGLAGGESDMQALVERAEKNDHAAELALATFCIAVRKFIGAYAALMGSIDLLVFTGGIGEHSAEIRRRICQGLEFIGLNTADSQHGKVKVMPSEEERQISRLCRQMLSAPTTQVLKS